MTFGVKSDIYKPPSQWYSRLSLAKKKRLVNYRKSKLSPFCSAKCDVTNFLGHLHTGKKSRPSSLSFSEKLITFLQCYHSQVKGMGGRPPILGSSEKSGVMTITEVRTIPAHLTLLPLF